jgi:hypothetical protein
MGPQPMLPHIITRWPCAASIPSRIFASSAGTERSSFSRTGIPVGISLFCGIGGFGFSDRGQTSCVLGKNKRFQGKRPEHIDDNSGARRIAGTVEQFKYFDLHGQPITP